jgi:restriction system protein
MKEVFTFKYDDLFNPTLNALRKLGGSGSVDEIEEQVASFLNLTDDQVAEIHRGNTSKLTYRLAWARNYLKRFGLITNSSRGIWALTELGIKTTKVDKETVKRSVKAKDKQQPGAEPEVEELEEGVAEEVEKLTWQENLLAEILKLKPGAFERLCQRLLRELGFQNVEVTGRVNDGGIDGRGILRLGGVLSFHVIFQAKRYKTSVSPSIVRDFRGAMIGRADKGLIITTGTFTREAKREATRDGAPPIDLIDGKELAEKLKELRMGVSVELTEKITPIKQWFKDF